MSTMTKPSAGTRATVKRKPGRKAASDNPYSLTPEQRRERRERNKQLIAAAKQRGGVDAIRNVPPIALLATVPAGLDPDSDTALLEDRIFVQPVVNPLFAALVEQCGGVRESARTWIVKTGKSASQSAFEKLFQEVFHLPTCYSGEDGDKAAKARKKGLRDLCTDGNALVNEINATECGKYLSIGRHAFSQSAHPVDGPHSIGAVVLSFTPGKMYVKVCTVTDPDSPELQLYPGAPDLNLFRPNVVRDPKPMTADVAVSLMEVAAQQQITVLEPSGKLAAIRRRLADSAVAIRVPGSPGLARLVVGCNRTDCDDLLRDPLLAPSDVFTHSTRSAVATAAELAQIDNLNAVHPAVRDMAALAVAEPWEDFHPTVRLKDYQQIMCGKHMATEIGLINATDAGGGKTPMTLRGFAGRARKLVEQGRIADEGQYTAIVFVEAALRAQWEDEARRFFDVAHHVTLKSKNVVEQVAQAREEQGDRPLVLLAGFHASVALAEAMQDGTLAVERFHDIAVDEAVILANPGSKQSKALWEIRMRSGVALALTGTPIERSEDDLGRLVAFVRGDAEMFHGLALSKRFDLTKEEGVKEMWRHLGPVMFRKTKSEFSSHVPIVQNEVVIFDGHSAEIALHDGARYHLKTFLTDMDKKIERLEAMDKDDPDYQQAKTEVAEARGTALGGITQARVSASDAVGVQHSTSPAAVLLDSAGLVEPAVRLGATKRKRIAAMLEELAAQNEAGIVFTEFSTVAQAMYDELVSRGVRVGMVKGGMSDKRRREVQNAFQGVPCGLHAAGEQAGAHPGCCDCVQPTIDVFVTTVEKGLNLQRATTMVHIDIKWMPSRLVQRIGRAARFGSRNSHVTNVIVLLNDTIEMRVVGKVVPRAIRSLTALDLHRGVNIEDTELGMAIDGLVDAVDDDEVDAADEGYMSLARSALADVEYEEDADSVLDWYTDDLKAVQVGAAA